MSTKEQRRKHALYMSEWRKKNPESYKATYIRYFLKNHTKCLSSQQKYRINLREKVINHYGNKCVCCGENNPKFLSIDHINNDGNKHRRSIKTFSGFHFALWVVKNSFPKFLQLLCYNCNMAKAHWGKCPHQE